MPIMNIILQYIFSLYTIYDINRMMIYVLSRVLYLYKIIVPTLGKPAQQACLILNRAEFAI